MSFKVLVILALAAVAVANPTPTHLLQEKGIIKGNHFPLPKSLPRPKLGSGSGPVIIGKCSLGGNFKALFKTLIGHRHYARNNLNDILNLKVGSFNDVCYLMSRLVVSLCDTLEASIRGLGSLLSRVIFSLLRIIICFIGGAGSGNPICRNEINLLVGVKATAVGDARGQIDLYGLGDVQERINLIISTYTRGRGIRATRGSLRVVLQLALDLVNRLQIIITRKGNLSKSDFTFCFHKISRPQGHFYKSDCESTGISQEETAVEKKAKKLNITCLLGVIGNSHKKGLGLQIINDFVPLCNQFIITAGFPDVSDIRDVRPDVESGNDDRAPWAMPDIDGVADTSVTISLGGLIGNLFRGLIGVTRLARNLIEDIISFAINTVDDVFTLALNIILGLGGALDATIAGLGSLLVRIVAGLLKIVLCFLGTGKYGVCKPDWDRRVGVTEDVTSIDLAIRLYGLDRCRYQVDRYIDTYTKGKGIGSTSGSIKIFLQSCITLSQIVETRKWDTSIVVTVMRHVTYVLGAVGNSNSKGVGTTVCNKFVPDCNKFLIQAGFPGLGNSQDDIVKVVESANDDDHTWCADVDTSDGQTGFIIPKPQPAPVGRPEPRPGPGPDQPKPEPRPSPEPVLPKPEPRPSPKPVQPKPEPRPSPEPVLPKPEPRPSPRPVQPTPRPGPVQPRPAPLGGLFKIIFGSIRGVSKLAYNALNILTSITINTLNDVFSLVINLCLVLEVTLNNLIVGLGSYFSRLVACIIKIGVCVNGLPGDRNICTRQWNKRWNIDGDASNAEDYVKLFKLINAKDDFNSIVTRHTRGKGIKSTNRSVRRILEKISSLTVIITNYRKITRQSITDSFVIITSISASVGNSRQRNSGKQIIENLLPQCGTVFKKEGYPDITVQVTVVTKDCDDSNDDNTDWNGGNNGNTTPSGGDNGNTTPSGGDNGNTTPSGGDNGKTTPSGGDNGNTTPSGGDNGNTTPSGGDNGKTTPSGGDNGNTTPSGGDNGKTTPSGGDNGNTTPSGGDYGNTTPSGGDNGNSTPSGGDNGNTTPSGGDNGNTTPSGGDNGKTTPSGGDNGNTTPSGGDNGKTTPSGGDNGNTTPSGGDYGNTTPSGGDNGNTTPSGGDNGNTTPSGGDNGNTTPSGGDNGKTTPSGGDNGNTTPSGGDNSNTSPSGGDNGNTTPSGGNNGNGNDCGKDIGGVIQVIPGVTKLSSTIITEIINIKITTFTDIVTLITKLTSALGGIIDSIVDGLGSILVRLVAVIFKIGYCVNGFSNNRGAVCTKEYNAQWGVVGEATSTSDIIALYRLNNCNSDVTKIINTYTNGKGISSTSGFIKIMLQSTLDFSTTVSSGRITKDDFSSVFISIIRIFGSIANNYKQGSATTVIQRVIPVCAPIFVQLGCQDIRTQQKTIISTINIAANVRFDWTTVKEGDNSKADKLATNVKKAFKNVKKDDNNKGSSVNAVLNLQPPRSFEDVCSFGVQVVQGLGSIIDVYINGLGSLIVKLVGALINYIVAILGAARNSKSFVSQKAYYDSFEVQVSGKKWSDISTGFGINTAKDDLDNILNSYTNNQGRGSLVGAELVIFDTAYGLVDIAGKGSAITEADLSPCFRLVSTMLCAFANSASAGVGKTICDNMLPTCSYYLEQNGYSSLASQQSEIYTIIDKCNNVKAPWTATTTTTVVEQQN